MTAPATADQPGKYPPGTWMLTASGRAWDIAKPSAADLWWPDVAHHLAQINRYTGACATPYSVAQHCCVVADALPPALRLAGLLHDAHEAYIGDESSPRQRALVALFGRRARAMRNHLTDSHDAVIYRAAGLPWPLPMAMATLIHRADLRALLAEKRDLMAEPIHSRPGGWPNDIRPLPIAIKPWPWARAADEWLERLSLYWPPGHKRGHGLR